ncbi:MAG: ABC transporter substrate-binding protein [Clostridioides sp.]|jgi:NitT/TauT family transport system substrate-binding protein|nr:ABC transporter substrate-binding protein [Clostridioides sp.]
MFNKKKFSIIMCSSLMILSLVSGCSKGKESAKTSEEDSYVINLGYYNCDHMTAAPVADQAGIYKELGLNVNIVGNGNVPEAMAAGQMDAGYIGTNGALGAVEKGSPLVIAANNHSGGSHYLVVKKDLKDNQELIGKKIAANFTDPYWTLSYAPGAGIPAEADKYEPVDIKSDKDKYLAFKTGKIDAFVACDPWGSVAELDGTGKIVSSDLYNRKVDNKTYNCCSFTLNQKFIDEHPELAKKMVLAHTKAVEFMYEHPVQAAKMFAKAYDVEEEVGLMTMYKKTVMEGRTITWTLDEQAYKDTGDIYKKFNIIGKDFDVTKYMNTNLLKESGADDFDKFIKEKIDPIFPVGMSYDDWKAKALEIDGE